MKDMREGVGNRSDVWPLVAVVMASWVLAIVMMAGGGDGMMAHEAVMGSGGIPRPGTLLGYMVDWQVMTGAMMVPSSLPMVRLFAGASRGQARPRLAIVMFVAAYFVVWTGFALSALTFDAGLHTLVERWRWLDARPNLIAGTVLVFAGAFQFSPLKERCLDACRSPMGFMWRYYRRGVGHAWELGLRHGLFCLGCCWALMLMMFAVGVGSLAWMAGMTGVMMIEKSFPWGRRLVPSVGTALILWGAFVLLRPEWLPAPFRA